MNKPLMAFVVAAGMLTGAFNGLRAEVPSPQPERSSWKADAPPVRLLALTEEQTRACQAEAQALAQRLQQCGNDQQCRQSIQAAIDAHNARCR